jgi:hypothetical protein
MTQTFNNRPSVDWSDEGAEYDAQIDARIKRKPLQLEWNNRGYWNKRRTILALVLLGILLIGTTMFVSSMIGSEAEQVQAVDELFTY